MTLKRAYEVHAEDASSDVWIVATSNLETAETLAERFKKDGYINIRIVKN
jgi:hypothetical protein